MQTWQKLKKNPKLLERYFVKEYMIKAIRRFFESREYHELESPILTSKLPQERYLDVLSTSINLEDGSNFESYLIPSTERFNKIALAAGIGNHFVITKVFRGLEEISPNHSPEFTMLEWYELGHSYFDLMDSTEELIIEIKKCLDEKQRRAYNSELVYQGECTDLSAGWYRISIREALEKYSGIKLESIMDLDGFRKVMKEKGYNHDYGDWQSMFELIIANEVEPKLPKDKPVFLYDFPSILCPLTQKNPKDSLVSQKVELYMFGKEVGNGYTELLDWQEQEKNFRIEQEARKKLERQKIKFDNELVEALKSGVPDVAGIGIGLDRLAMIFADVENISDINLFPISEMLDSSDESK